MLKKGTVAFMLLTVVLLIVQASMNSAISNSFGAPYSSGKGYTNSPFDNRACNISSCHGGSLNVGPGVPEITTNIPAEGYRAGQSYTVTATITQNGRNRFGFQMTSENKENHKSGRFTANSQTRAQSDFYITQATQSAASMGTNAKTWSFTWTAPSTVGTGDITFYGAFNAANNNGQRTGDNIYTTTMIVSESLLSGVAEKEAWFNLSLFPNPSTTTLFFAVHHRVAAAQAHYTIYDLNGQSLQDKSFRLSGKNHLEQIDVSDLTSGYYFLVVQNAEGAIVRKFIRQ
jgi:hypothetical protein